MPYYPAININISRRVAKIFSERLAKTSLKSLEDVFKTSCKTSSRYIQDVFKTSCKDVFKTS